ncbi:MAG: hypothetical protein K5894_14355 [Lachnospiraceae bacterium]|nr:hypothetical protein [Lachnospiraceae bacterium]
MRQNSLSKNSGIVLFFPIFLASTCSNLLDIASIFLDETIVGNLFEDAAFGAINAAEPFLLLQSFVSYLISIGGVSLIIRADAEKQYDRANAIFSQSITLCLILGGITFIIYSLFGTQMGVAVSGGTEVEAYVHQVISWTRSCVLVEPLYIFLFTYTLLMVGCFYALAMTIIEIYINYRLSVLLGMEMGIGGVMLATGISYFVGILLIALLIRLKKMPIKLKLACKISLAKEMVIIAFPESSYILSVAFMETVVNYFALKRYDVMGIAVASVVINLFELILHVSEGVSEYESAALNKYLGQRDADRLSHCIRVMIRAAIVEGLVFSVLQLTLADALVSIFDIDDPVTYDLAVQAVKIMALAPIIICFTRIYAIFFQYTKRTARAAFLIIMSWGILPGVFSWMIGSLSVDGMVWGVVLGTSVVFFIMLVYVAAIKKEKIWELTPEMYEIEYK